MEPRGDGRDQMVRTRAALSLAVGLFGLASDRMPMVQDARNGPMIAAHPGGQRSMQTNTMKQALERGETQVGVWINMVRNPAILRLMKSAGLDFARFDME